MISTKEHPNEDEEIYKILHPLVKDWFKAKFNEFAASQQYAVLDIHSRKNILVSAPTGSGKTLTAFLSVLNELIDSSFKGILEDKVYCVYVSPLKALNYDVSVNLIGPLKELADKAGRTLGIRVAVRTGDTTAKEKAAMLRHIPHILITTPESLAIMLNSPRFSNSLRGVQWCIIDEIHALAENKRGVHLSVTLERLQRLSGYMARVGLSATVAPLEEVAQFLVGNDCGKERDCVIANVQFLKQFDFKVLSPCRNLIDIDHKEASGALYNLLHELIQQHKTTLIFTNTRAATERVVHNLKERFSKEYIENIGAHHGSLSKDHRRTLEERLRRGELKVVVCSTSLELGIDIGYVDLVICLGSPKSVARFLQRAGRAGHKLHETVKARIIVMDRDDLVECSILMKSALEKKIDAVHIPQNCLDVLAQQIFGIAIQEQISSKDAYKLIRQSYCYRDIPYTLFESLLKYLSGEHVSLQDRHVYAKIWWDKASGLIGRRGKFARVIYMTNIGTTPEESFVTVKIAGTDEVVGSVDEGFLERLKPSDVFVLGGNTYEYKYSRGMVASVRAALGRSPTVPSWASEMLPLSFDLAREIGRFRKLMDEQFRQGLSQRDGVEFIHQYIPQVDANAAQSLYNYFWEQYHFSAIPSDKRILIEHYNEDGRKYAVFHTLFGRRVNDCLSRALAYAIGRQQHRDVEIGINDNGFYAAYNGAVNVIKAFRVLKPVELRLILEQAIEQSEILRRRFRHCACRSLMILREYKGHRKRVGRQQVSSKILMSAVKRLDNRFPILQEARREVLEDVMDIQNTEKVLKSIEDGSISVIETFTQMPSPFAFGLVLQGYGDVVKIEDKYEFVKRMHQMVLAKIGMKEKVIPTEPIE